MVREAASGRGACCLARGARGGSGADAAGSAAARMAAVSARAAASFSMQHFLYLDPEPQ